MRLCIVGSGYVGLVAAACFANTGNHVVGVDIDVEKVRRLMEGIIPIYEPGLDELVLRNIKERRLTFTTELEAAVQDAEVIFIAVGTPPGEDGSADLKHVLGVAEGVGRALNGYKVIVVKSTVPVGTCDRVEAAVAAHTAHPFDVVSNPEFLKEGAAVADFQKPDRVVVGTSSSRALDVMEELYAPFMRRSHRLLSMDRRSSEMTKYASNAMLATKISFMNEVARLCDAVGADVEMVRIGMSADERIGPYFIYPGCGYGGSCFPKDIKALVHTGAEAGVPMEILQSVEAVNGRQKRRMVEHLVARFGEDLSGRTFALWGLAFKPRTDDMREAPSEVVIRAILDAGGRVRATDPIAAESARAALADVIDRVELVEDAYACLEGCDALIVCTEWNQYRNPDFDRILRLLRTPVIVDGRNIYQPAKVRARGFDYYAIGRPAPAAT